MSTYARGRACAARREQERHCRVIARSMFGREPRDLGFLENGLVVAQERQFWGPLVSPQFTVFFHTAPDPPEEVSYDLPPIELPDPNRWWGELEE